MMRLDSFKDKLGRSRNDLGPSMDSPCMVLDTEAKPRTVIDKCGSKQKNYMSFIAVKVEHLAST